MKKALGYLMLAFVFGAYFVFGVLWIGSLQTLIIWAAVLAVMSIIHVAVGLIVD